MRTLLLLIITVALVVAAPNLPADDEIEDPSTPAAGVVTLSALIRTWNSPDDSSNNLLASFLAEDEEKEKDEKSESDDAGKEEAKPTDDKKKAEKIDKPKPDYVGTLSLNSISLDIQPPEDKVPTDLAGPEFATQETEYSSGNYRRDYFASGATSSQLRWIAPWVGYNPLYFEDARLERDGYHYGHFEPVVSAAKFYGRIPLWPYMVGATHPADCVYSLGHARPGDCTPYYLTTPKRSQRGLIYQATAITTNALLIP